MAQPIKKLWIEPCMQEIPLETLNPFGFLNELDGTLAS